MIPNFTKTSTVKKAIYDWAKLELGVEFAWLEQDVYRLPKPYGTLKIIPGFRKIGLTENLRYKTAGVFTLAGSREFTLSLNCYGENALGLVSFVQSSIEKPSVIEAFNNAGLVTVSASQVLDLSVLKDNNWESRAQIEVVFRMSVEVDDDVGFIEKVELNNGLDDSVTTIEV